MMNQFSKKVRVKKVLVILGVFFLLLQFQPGTKLLSGVYDESVFQEGKSQESIGHSRSVFSTPTIPTGNQVT